MESTFGQPVASFEELLHGVMHVSGDPQGLVGVDADGLVVQAWLQMGGQGAGWLGCSSTGRKVHRRRGQSRVR